jgi:hypothetical protein
MIRQTSKRSTISLSPLVNSLYRGKSYGRPSRRRKEMGHAGERQRLQMQVVWTALPPCDITNNISTTNRGNKASIVQG